MLLPTKKITRFEDIPQFTRSGSWECDFPLHRVVKFVEEQRRDAGLDIDPDFQRAHVWTQAQQTAWIEFFLRGGVTGRVLYFNCPSWGRTAGAKGPFVIVDGKQRLQAITRFVNGEIKAFGSYIGEYSDNLSLSRTMKINVNDLATRAEVLTWYIEFNSGGVVHTTEEIERVHELLRKEKRRKGA